MGFADNLDHAGQLDSAAVACRTASSEPRLTFLHELELTVTVLDGWEPCRRHYEAARGCVI